MYSIGILYIIKFSLDCFLRSSTYSGPLIKLGIYFFIKSTG